MGEEGGRKEEEEGGFKKMSCIFFVDSDFCILKMVIFFLLCGCIRDLNQIWEGGEKNAPRKIGVVNKTFHTFV